MTKSLAGLGENIDFVAHRILRLAFYVTKRWLQARLKWWIWWTSSFNDATRDRGLDASNVFGTASGG